MTEKDKIKNRYFLDTIIGEIPQYEVISFDIFDTLVLRDVLFPHDIFKILAKWVAEVFQIVDFLYIRINLEDEARKNSGREDVTLSEIYALISERYPAWPTAQIQKKELELELQHCVPNTYVKGIFEEAKKQKKPLWLISDMYLAEKSILGILKKCGYEGDFRLWLSGSVGLSKSTGSLYGHILEETQISPSHWLHIGDNGHSDLAVPHTFGIKTGYVRCPRDWYFLKREQAHKAAEEAAGRPLPPPPWDDSVEASMAIASEINREYVCCAELSQQVVVEAKSVDMMFNMSAEKVDNLKEYVIRRLKKELSFHAFWALKEVSLTIHKGEKVGLVGLNGSGKSTLLKVLSGVLKPTKGLVRTHGSIAPLIELGAGFDSELSARENVYLNGAILGYSRKEIQNLYDEIIDFAELKNFEDIAIKNYSSGMVARLGFSIATCQVPDILIIDEILAVGDFEFQKKCHKRMNELTEAGTTVIFVSHSPDDIVNMCDRAVWLSHGKIVIDGEAQYVVDRYLSN